MSALSTTGSVVAGRTRPTASSRRPASSSARQKSPSVSVEPDDHQVAERVTLEVARGEAVLERLGPDPASSAASATRHLRRSPGAGTPKSRRSRPVEPPSSATLTTAVISPAYARTPRNVIASPCPPPSATTFGPGSGPAVADTVDVPVADRCGLGAEPDEDLAERLGDRDAAVPTAGAADRDREVRLPFALVRRERELEQPAQLLEERLRVGLAEHVVAHGRVAAVERAQLLDPVRVREEAAVEDEVDVERQPVLVAEAHDADLQRLATASSSLKMSTSRSRSSCTLSCEVSSTTSAPPLSSPSSARSFWMPSCTRSVTASG